MIGRLGWEFSFFCEFKNQTHGELNIILFNLSPLHPL
jgi:hypothetical protein